MTFNSQERGTKIKVVQKLTMEVYEPLWENNGVGA